jgi:MOSC domain-containing protein YiiM
MVGQSGASHAQNEDMFEGQLVAIYVTAEEAKPMETRDAVHAVVGRGLQGDRYYDSAGTFSATPGAGREVTLIEREAVAAVNDEGTTTIGEHETRRNLVTEGVPLNHLVGKQFRVGDVVLAGRRLAEPCGHLQSLTRQGVTSALVHRGGLRADIVVGGTIRVGDRIELADGR